MLKLTIFDDDLKVAQISVINDKLFIFARSQRIWKEMKLLTGYKFTRMIKKKFVDVKVQDKDFLEHVAERAQGFGYSTELFDTKGLK